MKKQIKHSKMIMKYDCDKENALVMYKFETENTASADIVKAADANFFLAVAGDRPAPMEMCACMAGRGEGTKCISCEHDESGLVATYLCEGDKLEVTVNMQFIQGADAIRQINSVKNVSQENVTITHFSSAVITGIAAGGLAKWYLDESKIKIHYCLSHWQGEAQWRTDSPAHLGIYKKTAHFWDTTAWRTRSVGSWSTGRQYPLVMLEDTETGTIWYMELEAGYSWTIEVGNRNGKGMDEGTFYMEANAADEETGFVKVLKPGEVFEAAPALFGCTDGSFEEAVRQLTICKRKTTLAKWNQENIAPACFNDYWIASGEPENGIK